MFDWLPINRLAEARVARCEVGNRCNGKLICYRDCLISLSLSSRFHSCSSLSFRHRPLCLSIMLPSRELHGGGVWAFKPASKQKSTCASTRGELAWIGERFWQLSVSCILFFFFFLIFQLSVSWSSSPLFRNAVPPTPLHLCLSVWLMVWNIERCLFLLWLGRQGALWQTTRDQIDYAAFFFSVKSALMWLLSAVYCAVQRGKPPLA